jgi:GNAT superfamily N-acetyltransferase
VRERRREGYLLTTDPRRVDVDLVHRWLSEQSYWAKGRDRAVVERSIAGSRNYSVFEDAAYEDSPYDDSPYDDSVHNDSVHDDSAYDDSVYADARQAAFARAVTDGATFSWICDVFVEEQHRGKGLGSWLVESIVEDLTLDGVERFVLATRDAHEVYRRCGFAALAGPDRWMEIDERSTRAAVLGLD